MQNLEQKARDQEQSITEMEQRIIKLERENVMLRSVRLALLALLLWDGWQVCQCQGLWLW